VVVAAEEQALQAFQGEQHADEEEQVPEVEVLEVLILLAGEVVEMLEGSLLKVLEVLAVRMELSERAQKQQQERLEKVPTDLVELQIYISQRMSLYIQYCPTSICHTGPVIKQHHLDLPVDTVPLDFFSVGMPPANRPPS